MGTPPVRKTVRVRCHVSQAAGEGGYSALLVPDFSLVGKETVLVCEVDQYQLRTVGFTSMHSWTQLLERVQTLLRVGVAQGKRHWVCVWGYTYKPSTECFGVGVFPGE